MKEGNSSGALHYSESEMSTMNSKYVVSALYTFILEYSTIRDLDAKAIEFKSTHGVYLFAIRGTRDGRK